MQFSENKRYETEVSSVDSENRPIKNNITFGVKTTLRQVFPSVNDKLKISPLTS
jgi:hypothetical protein